METERLILRPLVLADAPFILRLLNEPSFIANINDKGVRTLDQARAYLQAGPMASFREHGHGLAAVVLKATGLAIGISGLIRRAGFQDIDLGYAFLPEHTGRGYALEAARAWLEYAFQVLGRHRVIALVSPGNEHSIHLLERCGFRCEGDAAMPEDGAQVRLYGLER
jgi:RimJ/RimL family protein N-acetyltransferase